MWVRFEKWVHRWEGLLIILALVSFLRIPSLFEPYWYGDEGIYLTLGQAVNRGEVLYKQIHDNKPPMIYWTAALALGNLFWFKFLAWWTGMVGTIVMYLMCEKVLGEKSKGVFWTTTLFALLTTIPLLEGNIANAELFFIPFTVGATYLVWDKEAGWIRVFLAGILFGLGGLFKIPALFEAGVWPIVWIVEKDKLWFKKCLVLSLGALLPIVGSGVYFAGLGALKEYLVAAWAQNIPYLSSWRSGGGESGIFSLKGRLVVLFIWLGAITGLGKRWGRTGLIVGVWGGISLFAALLSGRPYPHYLIQVGGIIALCVGIIVWGEKRWTWPSAGIISMVLASVMVFKFWMYPVGGYYLNFSRWAFRTIDTSEYRKWFNPKIEVDYEIAEIIMAGSKPEDRLFVWGDAPILYALTKVPPVGKYTARYHISDFSAQAETLQVLTDTPPKYIVDYGEADKLPGLESLLRSKYIVIKKFGDTAVYRLIKV